MQANRYETRELTRPIRLYTPTERYQMLVEAAEQVEAERAAHRFVWSCLLGAAIVGMLGLALFNFLILAAALALVAVAAAAILLHGEG